MDSLGAQGIVKQQLNTQVDSTRETRGVGSERRVEGLSIDDDSLWSINKAFNRIMSAQLSYDHTYYHLPSVLPRVLVFYHGY